MIDYSEVQLLLPMRGPNGSTYFLDYCAGGATITRSGAPLPTIVTAQSKHYGSSGFFPEWDSSNKMSRLFVQLATVIGTSPFTVRGWVRTARTDASIYLFDLRGNAANNAVVVSDNTFALILRNTSGKLAFIYGSPPTIEDGTTDFSANTWYHFALTRDESDVLRVFLDGNEEIEITGLTNNFSNQYAYVGGTGAGIDTPDNWVNDLELIIGTALYTASFTPPANQRTYNFPTDYQGTNTASVTLTGFPASASGIAVDVSVDRDSAPFYSATGQSANGSGELVINATNCPLDTGTRTVWIRCSDSDGNAGGLSNNSRAFYSPVEVTVS